MIGKKSNIDSSRSLFTYNTWWSLSLLRPRIEPGTFRSSVWHSPNWAISALYLNLLFTRDGSNDITTKLDDKRDGFGFHIVNFPFMSSNIPSAAAYGVYASQLVRYARCCWRYSDFLICHRALVKRLLSQGYKVNRLSNTFKKFYGSHTDLVGQYKKNVCQCLLILSVEMIFHFDGFANGQINIIS